MEVILCYQLIKFWQLHLILFMIGGLINGSIEVENPESKIVYLLIGNKKSSTQKIIIVD